MRLIAENWFMVVALVAVVTAVGCAVYTFIKMPSDKQMKKIKEWLLYAVAKAEKELGKGTGQMKLRYVYDMFIARFGWVAKIVSFQMFSMMVDEALEKMERMLENDKAMRGFIMGDDGTADKETEG